MRRCFGVLISVLVLAIGCGKGDFSAKTNEGKANIFRYPLNTAPTTLDPAMVEDGDTIDMIQQVYEGLVAWSTENKPVPNLAERWELTNGNRTYIFHLRHGVKFHNGNELQASDFKFTFERNCDPDLKSTMPESYLSDIVGVLDKVHRKAKEVSGVKVIDKYTLSITIDKPRAYFLEKLTYPVAFAIPKDSVWPGKEITSASDMVGTGPYRVASYDIGQKVTLLAFKDYHGGAPQIDGIERPVILDPAVQLSKFKNGELDMIPLQRKDLEGIKQDATLSSQLHYFDRAALWYLGLNSKEYAPFANKKVRQAFAAAINRGRIVHEELGDVNEPANTILPPQVPGYRKDPKIMTYDPAKAQRLLAEAGYPNGKGLPPLVLMYRQEVPDIRIVADVVSGDLEKNLGIKVTERTMEWGAYLKEYEANKVPFFHMRWMADYLDPQDFLSLMLTTKGNENHIYYSNAKVDELCSEADASVDQAKRTELYTQAENIVLDDAPFVPIYFQKDVELISPRVRGLRESAFGHLPHTTVKLIDK
jgi:oligopeptide transport system substrate-binding protein